MAKCNQLTPRPFKGLIHNQLHYTMIALLILLASNLKRLKNLCSCSKEATPPCFNTATRDPLLVKTRLIRQRIIQHPITHWRQRRSRLRKSRPATLLTRPVRSQPVLWQRRWILWARVRFFPALTTDHRHWPRHVQSAVTNTHTHTHTTVTEPITAVYFHQIYPPRTEKYIQRKHVRRVFWGLKTRNENVRIFI